MPRRSGLIAVLAVAVAVAPGTAIAADDLLYRRYPNLCNVRPDGTKKRQLTRDGKRSGPVYAWVSASRNGRRLGISFGNDTYVANARGRRLGDNYRDTGGAAPVVQISPNGRILATIEPTLQLQPPPPGGSSRPSPLSTRSCSRPTSPAATRTRSPGRSSPPAGSATA